MHNKNKRNITVVFFGISELLHSILFLTYDSFSIE